MTVTALSPLMMESTTTADSVAAAPATPTTTTRRTHNPYLRAPPTAAIAAFAGSLSLSSTAAPSPTLGCHQSAATAAYTAATQQQLPTPSPMHLTMPQFPAVVKPQQQHGAVSSMSSSMIAKASHPMRPQQQQPQFSAAATIMMAPSPSPASTSCICGNGEMGMGMYSQQASSCMMTMGMGTPSQAPSAMMMMPPSVQQHQLQPYVMPSQQQQPPHAAPVSIISHKDLSGSALRYVRFTPLDTTSAAAPRRDRPSGPFQAPAMPPVINEALMASPDASTLVDVFVSQLPFDLPLQALRGLADAVVPGAPIRIAHAAPHQRRNGAYDGCCFVKMPEADAHRFIAALHKRVLFDVFGLWVADCPAGLEELTAYCAHMQSLRPEARRRVLCRPTPFSAVTAELAKRVYAF